MAEVAGAPDYRGLEILSPMVRGSSLPLRLCSLHYGAGLVYHGCQVDRRILETRRVENEAFGCIDYVSAREGRAVFSTCAAERQHVIFQLGTCDAALATQAALHVCQDVRGVDVNMGCTASFTTSGGMGSELLDKPELAADILKSLRRELPPECAVSCKIRMLPDTARTRDFLQLCERSGADAVAVHLRTVAENRKDKMNAAHWSEMAELCSAVQIPVIANGDFLSRSSITEFWEQQEGLNVAGAGPAAVMIARGALWNPAIFSEEGVNFDEVVCNYIQTAIRTGNPFENTKWGLKEMTVAIEHGKPKDLCFGQLQGRALRKFRAQVDAMTSMSDMCRIFDTPYDEDVYPQGAFSLDYSASLLGLAV